jgi:hypothetical protein
VEEEKSLLFEVSQMLGRVGLTIAAIGVALSDVPDWIFLPFVIAAVVAGPISGISGHALSRAKLKQIAAEPNSGTSSRPEMESGPYDTFSRCRTGQR